MSFFLNLKNVRLDLQKIDFNLFDALFMIQLMIIIAAVKLYLGSAEYQHGQN